MSTSAETIDQASAAADENKPHPRGLYVLFATEMWERFSYYGMRALLVLYLVSELGKTPQDSSSVYKWYTSLVYLTPLLGGFLADRYLGLRASIIAGGALMALGQFMLTTGQINFFYAGLALLIAGNGFFKPNISTMVGKMYRPGDNRRDRAFTIFYMGINLGAFFSPLVCGLLAEKYSYAWGFGAAGVGMLVGLCVFLAGQKRVLSDVAAAGNDLRTAREQSKSDDKSSTAAQTQRDEETPGAGGAAKIVSAGFPILMIVAAAGIWAQYGYKLATGEVKLVNAIMPFAFGGIAVWMGITLRTIKGAARDKSVVIFALFIFAVLFWMAFEQAGNALNLWAQYHTDLHIGTFAYPAGWFQSVNAIFIVMLAPVFTALWAFLAKRNAEPSTPAKMLASMVLMALSFFAMVGGAAAENSTVSRVELSALPQGVALDKVAAGRMAYDAEKHELTVRGVLPTYAMSEALAPTVPPAYLESIKALEAGASNSSERYPYTEALAERPAGYKVAFGEDEKKIVVSYDEAAGKLTVKKSISAEMKVKLLGAAAPAEYRDAITALAQKSEAARVGGLWLVLSYFLATLAELCLSPVGLSMVTKLAPARFASLFMGIWLLASSVAQYVGGALGEMWGSVAPTNYFMIFVYTSAVGAVVLVLLVAPLKKLMHGVK